MVTTVSYGDSAWIGNLIVLPEHRNQGVGRELMEYGIKYLESTGTHTIRLDSVQLATPLYSRLGFKEEYQSLRFTGVAKKNKIIHATRMNSKELSLVAEIDKSFFKACRKSLLEYKYKIYPDLCYISWLDDSLIGYIMAKRTRKNIQIGPWIVSPDHSEIAENLLYSVMNQCVRENIWIGVPEGNKNCVEILHKNGFNSLPSSLRMCYGKCSFGEDVSAVYSLGGPYKG
jgi:hypothetical protein